MARRDEEGGVAVLNRPVGEDGELPATNSNGTEGAATGTGTRRARVKRDVDQMGPNEMISLNVRVPNALRLQLASTATEQSTSVPQLVAQMLATAYNFELPKPQRAARIKKYASAEERKAAQKADQQRKRMVTKAILRAVEQGTLPGLDIDAMVAQIAEEEAKKAASGAETQTAVGSAS